jgi:hypothetical protein
MKRSLLLFAVSVLFGTVGRAQEIQKFEITGVYSYFREDFGLPSYFNSQNMNGGGGDATYFFTTSFGVKADLQGYTNALDCAKASAPTQACPKGGLFTYMFGPELKLRRGHFEPFAEVLVGGAHTSFYKNTCLQLAQVCNVSIFSPSTNTFSLAVGGGIDLSVRRYFSFRLVDVDYVLTRFNPNIIGGNNTQNNLRVQTGIQFRF